MFETLVRNWWAITLRGVMAIIFAILAFLWPGITLATLILIFGVYSLVDGIFAILWSLFKSEGSFPWAALLGGLVSIGAGIVTFAWPTITALALVLVIAAWALVRGAFEIVAAIQLRKVIEHEWALVIAGIASVIFGILLMIAPGAGALALLWIIAAFAMALGIIWIAFSLELRHIKQLRAA